MKDPSKDDDDWMKAFERMQWPELRKKGKQHFLWRERVLGKGLPIGLGAALFDALRRGFGFKDLLRTNVLAELYLLVSLAMVLAYVDGWFEWERREKEFNNSHK